MKKTIISIICIFILSNYILAKDSSADSIFDYLKDAKYLNTAYPVTYALRTESVEATIDYIIREITKEEIPVICLLPRPRHQVVGPINTEVEKSNPVKNYFYYPLYDEKTKIKEVMKDKVALFKVYEMLGSDLTVKIEIFALVPVEKNKFKSLTIEYEWEIFLETDEMDYDDETKDLLIDGIINIDPGIITLHIDSSWDWKPAFIDVGPIKDVDMEDEEVVRHLEEIFFID